MCLSGKIELLNVGTLSLGAIAKPSFILALVINMEVAKTTTSF